MTEPEPRPALTAALTAFFQTSALFDALRLRIWEAEGLTVTQLRLISLLAEEGGLSNAALAERLYVTRPSVSALLDRLERGGFIRREVSPTDRRGICIWLEERGRDAISHLNEEIWRYSLGLFEDVDEATSAQVAASLGKLVEAGRGKRARDLAAEAHLHR